MASQQLSEQQLKTIAETLKAAREEKGENLAEAAFRIALSPSQLRAIESGDLRPFYSPGYFLQAAQRYADFLGVTLDIAPPPPPPPPESPATAATESTMAAHETAGPDGHRSSAVPAEPTPTATAIESASSGTSTANAPAPQAAVTAGEDCDAGRISPTAMTEPAADSPEKTAGVPWGWVAFGAAALIAIGIVKISFDKPTPARESIAKQEPAKAETEASTPAPTAASAPPAKAPSPAINPAPSSAPAPAPAPTATPAPSLTPPVKASPVIAASDSQLESQASTWVQIVKSNGEKVNTKIEPGQKLDFASSSTAAIVFGQPDKAALKIQGKPVNIAPFITSDTPPRALVILNQIKN